ncbi:hypothetical protein BDV96DRAFT_615180 [Lophiotrema nucula]|uniref:Rhodopsin domain-containing protein n=1 Tax=Lophiotrema nucula TaxID=690887 RepID=A0A6A5YUH7_9PLEO|nr:hypothetical protein BDV96DRAFT_615180 [Lophiotrema nucula]
MTLEGRSDEVVVVAILFFFLTWICVSLRVYVRGVMLKTWGKDDTAIVVTLVIFTIYLIFQLIAAVRGTGRHRWELDDEDARIALIFWYLCELLYVLSSCGLKISLGIFYLRVAMQRWQTWVIKLLMVGTVLFGATYFLLVLLQCIPVSEFWKNHPASSKCIPKAPTLGITYALAAVNASADWVFGTLPFFIVWDLQMNLKTKLLVAGILTFAAIGSTGTVVRMKYIHTLTNGPDFLWATTDVAIWSTVEPGIGITATSMATLRPLLQTCLWRMGPPAAPSSARPRTSERSSRSRRRQKRDGYRREFGLADLVPTQEGSTSTTVSGPQKPDKAGTTIGGQTRTSTDLEAGGINKKVVMEQEFEGPPRLTLRDSLRNSFRVDAIWKL